jgi:hypothetical protein
MSLSTKDQVITLYLTPLLEKHNRKQTITWDDLLQAKQAADAFLQQQQQTSGNKDADSDASDELQKLHKSQLALYREQATVALTDWCRAWKLPDPIVHDNSNETLPQYTQRCLALAFEERPFWKMGTGLLQKLLSPIVQERAASHFADCKRSLVVEITNSANANMNDEESEGEVPEEDEEDGEVLDDAEGAVEEEDEDEEDGEVTEDATTTEPATATETSATDAKQLGSKKPSTMNKKRNIPVKKAMQRKKRPGATSEKANQPNRAGMKKRGRGGAAVAASNKK